MKRTLSLILILMLCLALLAGCGGKDGGVSGVSYTPVTAQSDALMEVKSGTATAAIIDSVMAEAMVGPGTDYEELKIVDAALASEEYAIGFRNGSTAVAKVNEAIAALLEEGKLQEIAEKYELSLSLIDEMVPSDEADTSEDDDWAYIEEKGTMVIGITEYAPMNYYDDGGTLIGFDTEFAQAVCEKLGVEAEFVVIEWSMKETELESKNVDCLWNGLTMTVERQENMDFSASYMLNKQVLVVKDFGVVAEAGSAGETAAKAILGLA